MNLIQLLEALTVNRLGGKLYEKKNRIYLQSESKKFSEYIQQNDDDTYTIKVFLADKKFGDKYDKSEWRECFQRRNVLVEKINSFGIGLTFDEKGVSKPSDEMSDIDLILNM